jgi:GPH family glycoside/pentoside/hexuronide:cation symporter
VSDPTLPLARLFAYGGPILGLSCLLFFVQFYFLKFATDVLLLPPAIVGALFALAKLWDAVSDPLVGSWSDRSRSRWGRRLPFLVAALPLLVAGYVMLWSPPAALSARALIAWSGIGLFVFYTAFTLYTLPHVALGAELSTDSHQRTRLFAVRQMSFTVGILLAFGGIQVAMNAAEPRAAAAGMALPVVIGAVALLALVPLLVREPERAERRGGENLWRGLRDVAGNRPARLLLAVQFIEAVGVGAVGTMAPFVAEYLLGRKDAVAFLPAAYVIAAVASIPLWVRISRSFGKRDTWLAAMVLATGAFGGLAFLGRGDVAAAVALLVVAGSAMGCGSVLSASILADVIDADESRTGERKEGVYSASLTFMLKLGTALATAASGVVLGAVGFEPNAEQSERSLLGIRLLFGGMPFAGFAIGALLFTRMPRDVGALRTVARATAAE